MARESLLNKQNVRAILAAGEGVTTVATDAIEWVDAVTRLTAENLAATGRRSPSGRLMAPKLDPGLMARHIAAQGAPTTVAAADPARPETPAPEAGAAPAKAWGTYEDWQTEVKQGLTKLAYDDWRKGADLRAAAEEMLVAFYAADADPVVRIDRQIAAANKLRKLLG